MERLRRNLMLNEALKQFLAHNKVSLNLHRSLIKQFVVCYNTQYKND